MPERCDYWGPVADLAYSFIVIVKKMLILIDGTDPLDYAVLYNLESALSGYSGMVWSFSKHSLT